MVSVGGPFQCSAVNCSKRNRLINANVVLSMQSSTFEINRYFNIPAHIYILNVFPPLSLAISMW